MKIAIPLYRDRVAPHFGTASTVLMFEISGDKTLRKYRCKVSGNSTMETARSLFESGISTLICGGIEAYCKNWLIQKGVTVLDNQMGTAWEVLAKYLESKPVLKEQAG